jgi:hypothetical protein
LIVSGTSGISLLAFSEPAFSEPKYKPLFCKDATVLHALMSAYVRYLGYCADTVQYSDMNDGLLILHSFQRFGNIKVSVMDEVNQSQSLSHFFCQKWSGFLSAPMNI